MAQVQSNILSFLLRATDILPPVQAASHTHTASQSIIDTSGKKLKTKKKIGDGEKSVHNLMLNNVLAKKCKCFGLTQ